MGIGSYLSLGLITLLTTTLMKLTQIRSKVRTTIKGSSQVPCTSTLSQEAQERTIKFTTYRIRYTHTDTVLNPLSLTLNGHPRLVHDRQSQCDTVCYHGNRGGTLHPKLENLNPKSYSLNPEPESQRNT